MRILGGGVVRSWRRAVSFGTPRGVVRAGSVAAVLLLSACYQYTPIESDQPVGDLRVEVDLTDQGRIALRDQVGVGARTIEGRVLDQNAETISLAVYRVTDIRGESFTWTGERVQVPVSGVSSLARRDFDKARSAVAAATAAGVFAVFVVSRNLLGGGREPSGTDGPPAQSIRVRP